MTDTDDGHNAKTDVDAFLEEHLPIETHAKAQDLVQELTPYVQTMEAAVAGAKRGAHRVSIGGNPASPDVVYYWNHAGRYGQVWP